jgi:hypothetical protein
MRSKVVCNCGSFAIILYPAKSRQCRVGRLRGEPASILPSPARRQAPRSGASRTRSLRSRHPLPCAGTPRPPHVTDARSNVSSISSMMSTSFGSSLAVTNDPNTMKRANWPVDATSWYSRFNRSDTAQRCTDHWPKRSRTSASVAPWTPGGSSPSSSNAGSAIDVPHVTNGRNRSIG